MAYLNDELRSIQEFAKFTSAGLDVADFVQIRASIIERYKAAYGQDIDVSTNNADGVFVNDLALIINNILQSLKTMYANLDVNTATGVYLDNLCRLSNIIRKDATYSQAQLRITNIGSSAIQIIKSSQTDGIIFVDQAGEEWYYKGESFTLEPTVYADIIVEASQTGLISAKPGWINQAINEQYLDVLQSQSAVEGSLAETDAQLRARRNQSVGAQGSTVLESLAGELLSLNSIEDVKIYNNWQDVNSGPDTRVNTKDGSILSPHSIYVIIRKRASASNARELSNLSDKTIGDIIYQKLTPGISTSNGGESVTNGIVKSHTISQTSLIELNETVSWKEATPISPEIVINIVAYNTYDEITMNNKVLTYIVDYLNSLQLSSDLIKNELIAEILNADPTANARSTYYLSSISGINESYVNPDTYFKYSVNKSTIEEIGTTGEFRNFKITLRGE